MRTGIFLLFTFLVAFFTMTILMDGVCRHNGYYTDCERESLQD